MSNFESFSLRISALSSKSRPAASTTLNRGTAPKKITKSSNHHKKGRISYYSLVCTNLSYSSVKYGRSACPRLLYYIQPGTSDRRPRKWHRWTWHFASAFICYFTHFIIDLAPQSPFEKIAKKNGPYWIHCTWWHVFWGGCNLLLVGFHAKKSEKKSQRPRLGRWMDTQLSWEIVVSVSEASHTWPEGDLMSFGESQDCHQ